jgi:hypothetical protein
MAKPNDKVKKHLDKNHVNPDDLPASVIDTLNTLTQDELDAMDKVGDSLDKAKVADKLWMSTVH